MTKLRCTLFVLVFCSLSLVQAQSLTVFTPQEPRTMLPHFDLLTLAQEAQRLVYECLFVLDQDGAYVPQLAAEVPSLENGGISADGTTYTIKLRPGIVWQNGEPLTSEDVAFTWQVITDPDLPIPSRTVWDTIESVETPDPLTAVVRFAEANVSFLGAASSGNCFILPKHILEGSDMVNSSLNRDTVGTGPFTLAEWQSGSFMRFVKSDSYRDADATGVDEIIYQIASGSEAQRVALQRDEIDLLLHITLADLRFVEGLEPYQVQQVPTFTWWHFWLNNEDPILTDLAVRQALSHAIDKTLITETLMGDVVEPLDAVLPPSHWAHNPEVSTYAYDPDRAAALLEQAGWQLGADGIRSKDGQALELEILNIAGQAERLQVVQAVQALWRAVGVDVSIREIDAASFPPTMAGGEYQVAYGFFGETQEPSWNLWLGTNWQNYTNEEAFDLLRQTASTLDLEARRQLILDFQEIIADDAVLIPLAPRPLLNVVHERLTGHAPTLTGTLWNAEDWIKSNE